ncbi:MAG: hypothetical protein GY847_04910 [Proteobacteria bacterium]|nr:hypothetical protein [Pseudomonadota bacterium]
MAKALHFSTVKLAPKETNMASSGGHVFKFSILPVWKMVKAIREETEKRIESKGWNKDFVEAVTMCITELTENAIKYGTGIPGEEEMKVRFEIHDELVLIKASNGIRTKEDLENVTKYIDKTKECDDIEALYVGRLVELMENPKSGVSQLGLLRIAYEGEFDLDYEFGNDILTIIATRKTSTGSEE